MIMLVVTMKNENPARPQNSNIDYIQGYLLNAPLFEDSDKVKKNIRNLVFDLFTAIPGQI